MTLGLDAERVRAVYVAMFDRYGPQSWWPGESCLEVMIGAVLTQNTRWSNVERALENMRAAEAMTLERLLELSPSRLAQLIRPSGCFNVKARRLVNLFKFVDEQGGESVLRMMETSGLRKRLLAVSGIGPETADDILLYGFGRPVFVVDGYARRLFQRLGFISGSEPYESIRSAVEQSLTDDAALFNELHALIVRHGKQCCRPDPLCHDCCLLTHCQWRQGDEATAKAHGH